MANKKELAEQATQLAALLGEQVETEGLTKEDLEDLVSSLNARVEAASSPSGGGATGDDEPPAPPAPEPKNPNTVDGTEDGTIGGPPRPPAPAAPAPPQVFPYQVAQGKAITSARGVLGPGAEVKASDLSGGEEALEDLVIGGYVTKAKK